MQYGAITINWHKRGSISYILRIYPLPGGTEGNHKNVHQDNQSLVWN
jgi:hypothetical protein